MPSGDLGLMAPSVMLRRDPQSELAESTSRIQGASKAGSACRRATRCGSITCPVDSLHWGHPFDLGCPGTCLLLLCWALTSGPTETSGGASCAFALRRLPPAGSGRPQRLGSLRERICSCGSPDVGVGKFRDPVKVVHDQRITGEPVPSGDGIQLSKAPHLPPLFFQGLPLLPKSPKHEFLAADDLDTCKQGHRVRRKAARGLSRERTAPAQASCQASKRSVPRIGGQNSRLTTLPPIHL